jgi:hypothetical protein
LEGLARLRFRSVLEPSEDVLDTVLTERASSSDCARTRFRTRQSHEGFNFNKHGSRIQIE